MQGREAERERWRCKRTMALGLGLERSVKVKRRSRKGEQNEDEEKRTAGSQPNTKYRSVGASRLCTVGTVRRQWGVKHCEEVATPGPF